MRRTIVAKPSAAGTDTCELSVNRLLKNSFFSSLRSGIGIYRHFSNTHVFEKWSKAKTTLFALRAEKGREGLFQQPVKTGKMAEREAAARILRSRDIRTSLYSRILTLRVRIHLHYFLIQKAGWPSG